MTEAQKILGMIESVDPGDEKTLDEIDNAVLRYLYIQDIKEYAPPCIVEMIEVTPQHFTRSRDALKAIRPEGCLLWVFSGYTEGARAELWPDREDNYTRFITDWLPTEELAELSAIIKALEHERTNK